MRRFLGSLAHKGPGLLAVAGVVALLSVAWLHAQTTGSAFSFAIVGGAAVTVNGAGSVVNGDVGIAPAAALFITGFPGFPPLNGVVTPPFAVRGLSPAAEASADALFNSAAMAPAGGFSINPNLSLGSSFGQPAGHYVPGKYNLAAVAVVTLPTTMTLDGAGTYIFSFPTQLTTSVGARIILNGADPCDVWWRVPTIATIDNGPLPVATAFPGNIVSNALIAVGAGTTVFGRLLTTAPGSVTLAGSDIIGGCSAPLLPPPPPPPVPPVAVDLIIIKHHTGTFVVGTPATYTIQLQNLGSTPSSGQITVTDTLPAGLTFVSATGVNSWTCSANGQVVTCTTPASVTGIFGNPITLTVLPTAVAVPAVTNTAIVAGGNDTDFTNNTTADITLVVTGVPTLPQWAFLVLTALMVAAGVVALRRRRA